MKIEILTRKQKLIYITINTSIITCGTLLIIAFPLSYFQNDTIGIITVFFMINAIVPLITGITSCIILAITKKKYIEIDEKHEIKLILNINQDDYKEGHLKNMRFSGNFLSASNSELEITSVTAKELLQKVNIAQWDIKFQTLKTKALQNSPKQLFHDFMWMLWAAS